MNEQMIDAILEQEEEDIKELEETKDSIIKGLVSAFNRVFTHLQSNVTHTDLEKVYKHEAELIKLAKEFIND